MRAENIFFELLCRVIKLSVKSVDLIEKISEKGFE